MLSKPVITESQFLAQLRQADMYSVDTALTTFWSSNVEAAFERCKSCECKSTGRYTGLLVPKAIITLAADSKAIELFATEAE